jgi:hypothetical protein
VVAETENGRIAPDGAGNLLVGLLRIQAKMKRVRAGIERWHKSGKDPRAVGKLIEGAKPLADGGKLDELENLVDRALEMLGETEKVPDVYRKP